MAFRLLHSVCSSRIFSAPSRRFIMQSTTTRDCKRRLQSSNRSSTCLFNTMKTRLSITNKIDRINALIHKQTRRGASSHSSHERCYNFMLWFGNEISINPLSLLYDTSSNMQNLRLINYNVTFTCSLAFVVVNLSDLNDAPVSGM